MEKSNKLTSLLKNIFTYQENEEYNFYLSNENSMNPSPATDEFAEYKEIFSSINVNLEYLKYKYNALINSDVKFRQFQFTVRDKQYNACIIYIDGMVVLLGFITFGFTTMLYSMIVPFLISELSNRTMLKINHNQILFIQSKKIEEIKTLLTKEFTYDVTLLNTTGGYSKEKRKTLFCAISKKDYYMIKESILLIDKNAFITVVTAYETQNGNKSLKAHMKEINTQES